MKHHYRNGLALILAIASLLPTAGCKSIMCFGGCNTTQATPIVKSPTPSNAFVSPLYSQLRPHRVAIVTPANRMHEFREQDQFAAALANGLREHGVFEAVVGEEVSCNLNAIQSGHFDEQQLVNLARLYNVDAILYCDVNSFSAYTPLQASVALSIIDARESVVLFCSDGIWNTRSAGTLDGFEQFLKQSGENHSVAAGLESPSDFVSYIADSTASFISQY